MQRWEYLQILQVNLRSSLEWLFQSPDLNHIPTENVWIALNKQVHAGSKLVGDILTIIESNLLTFFVMMSELSERWTARIYKIFKHVIFLC